MVFALVVALFAVSSAGLALTDTYDASNWQSMFTVYTVRISFPPSSTEYGQQHGHPEMPGTLNFAITPGFLGRFQI